MITDKAGKIVDGLWYFGRQESGIYLLEGSSCSMIISGGMNWILPEVLDQMERFGIDEQRIEKLLILHAHFDHIGLVPFFKRRLPRLTVYASAPAWRIINNPEAIDTINRFSRTTAEYRDRAHVLDIYDCAWRFDVGGVTVAEGDVIDCGDNDVRIIETPGHSSCSVSAYVPAKKALFPSDGGGIPHRGGIIASGNSNYTLFQQSLEKLSSLEVDLLGADHGGYMTGEDARRFIGRTIDVARDFRKLMEELYCRMGSVDSAVDELIIQARASRPDFFLPSRILRGVYGQMLRHVAAMMDEGRQEGPHVPGEPGT
ncbi:MAG: MBL fold metallo-hydrolase [Syntrophales bacterium]|jgi:glyoxylase-like metal-dependent hydrolase (beta-lactamase superfamily II)|nr:MBL fold metallo-hydrolase [Syntrophales bacterium]MCK9527569.1 MBL fold metallo-hydrolase [Syntrophales bacterium]MDX9922626.1 MBL fold metallo-hydrolase [Syntrophales bacterium]